MKHKRFEVVTFRKGGETGNIVSVQVNFGYWEKPNVEEILDELSQKELIHIKHDHREWLLYMLQDRACEPRKKVSFLKGLRIKAFQVLQNNSAHSDQYFGLGQDISLSTETVPVYLD